MGRTAQTGLQYHYLVKRNERNKHVAEMNISSITTVCRFASETKQMPQQVVSYRDLTTHKV